MKVYATLRAAGKKVEVAGYYAPFDLLIDGKIKAEVKTCLGVRSQSTDNLLEWHFNIHRHNGLSEGQADIYIFRLENIPECKYALHLLLKAPLCRKTIGVSMKSLLNGKWIQASKDFKEFIGRKQ